MVVNFCTSYKKSHFKRFAIVEITLKITQYYQKWRRLIENTSLPINDS